MFDLLKVLIEFFKVSITSDQPLKIYESGRKNIFNQQMAIIQEFVQIQM